MISKSPSVAFLTLVIIISLVAVPTVAQMMYFDSFLHCASSVKQMAGHGLTISANLENPLQVIPTAGKSLKLLPVLLDNCGKQTYAKTIKYLISRECIDLFELQTTFSLKIYQLTLESLDKNAFLISFYDHLIRFIKQKQQKQCQFLSLNVQDLASALQLPPNSQCLTQAKIFIDEFKQSQQQGNEATGKVFSNLTQLTQQIFSLGKTCILEYEEYFPAPCINELINCLSLISTMNQYQTSASWIWDNIRPMKKVMQGIKDECPKLVALLF